MGRLWIVDALTGAVEKEVGMHSLVNSVAWSPSGTKVATGCVPASFHMVDVVTGTVEWELQYGVAGDINTVTLSRYMTLVLSVAWSPAGTKVATGSVHPADAGGNRLRILHAATGAVEREVLYEEARSVAWSPVGTTLALGSSDVLLRIIDAATGAVRKEVGLDVLDCVVAWSP